MTLGIFRRLAGQPIVGCLTPHSLAQMDGKITVTVNAGVSENVTTSCPTATSYWDGPGGTGTQIGSPVNGVCAADNTSSGGITKTGSGSNTSLYVLDINPPTLTLHPFVSQPTVLQG